MKYLVGILSIFQLCYPITSTREVCSSETLRMSCAEGEVILMEQASYGRMRFGRCVESDYGYVGCYADVIDVLDSYCSGRRECELSASDHMLRAYVPCPRKVDSYLEYSYKCVAVATLTGDSCLLSKPVKLLDSSGYLSNMAAENGEGQNSCSYMIETDIGKTIGLVLINFQRMSSEPLPSTCRELFIVEEQVKGENYNVKICRSNRRTVNVFHSRGNSIKVIMKNTVSTNEPKLDFLVQYRALYCEDPEIPENAVAERVDDYLVVYLHCGYRTEKFYLICEAGRWWGRIGRCPDTGGSHQSSADGYQLP